jgi:hypothetical protein
MQVPFQESADQEGQEVEEEEGFDAPLVLEQNGGDFVDGLRLFEAALDDGLALVGFQGRGEAGARGLVLRG